MKRWKVSLIVLVITFVLLLIIKTFIWEILTVVAILIIAANYQSIKAWLESK